LVLHMCIGALDSSRCTSGDIFDRLAPLLLLRRLPASFFRIPERLLRQSEWYSDVEKLDPLLVELCSHVTRRLDNCHDGDGSKEYSSQERRLAAEIAGRSLPFGSGSEPGDASKLFSCYEVICRPAFIRLQTTLRKQGQTKDDTLLLQLQSAKAALYAVCTALAYASEDETGGELLDVALFSIDMLETNVEHDIFTQLQIGCMEFFANCFETFFRMSALHRMDPQRRVNTALCDTDETMTFLQATARIVDEIFTAARTGTGQMANGYNLLSHNRAASTQTRVSVEARICLWNSLVLVAQRCNSQKEHFRHFFDMVLPKTLEWGNEGPIDGMTRHPLCVAAAMQVIIVLLSRTATEISSWKPAIEDKRRSILEAHGWASKAFTARTNNGDIYSHSSLRCNALKLMIATQVLADSSNGLASYLTHQEMHERLSLLQMIATEDSDEQVRRLARQLLLVTLSP
jgi:hypothetical protein